MDAEYLKREVGPVLSGALAEVAVVQPPDPVEYVAQWLYNYLAAKEREAQRAKDAVQLAEERMLHEGFLENERKRKAEQEAKEAAEREEHEKARLAELHKLAEEYAARKKEREEATKDPVEGDPSPVGLWKARLQAAVKEISQQQTVVQELLRKHDIHANTLSMLQLVLQLVESTEGIEEWPTCRRTMRKEGFISRVISYDPLTRQRIKKCKAVGDHLKGPRCQFGSHPPQNTRLTRCWRRPTSLTCCTTG
eukprot:TRINITY_DN3718_c0_g1_i2.p1 TRINITY_DN3718_c0_g1~~TRINITY_DN3718_c0_g1_i2.p1  ORF type:complete len:259 (-),score=77.42 TRINITY_DN3718_c0_g1_i2:343-1095(-)